MALGDSGDFELRPYCAFSLLFAQPSLQKPFGAVAMQGNHFGSSPGGERKIRRGSKMEVDTRVKKGY